VRDIKGALAPGFWPPSLRDKRGNEGDHYRVGWREQQKRTDLGTGSQILPDIALNLQPCVLSSVANGNEGDHGSDRATLDVLRHTRVYPPCNLIHQQGNARSIEQDQIPTQVAW
jgi:hypothetical protein